MPSLDALSEALRRVAIAGRTVKAGTGEPNEIYHLLNSDLRPLCGSGTVEGPFVMAVKAAWPLRCDKVGCDLHWRFITEVNEVITTAEDDRCHYDVKCRAFRDGLRGIARVDYHLHGVKQMSIWDAEKAGKPLCPSCGQR